MPHNSNPAATLPAPPARRDHTSTRPYARGPFHPHVNPIGGGLGRLPTMPPIGFSCALEGSCCQRRGPAASTATTTDTTAPKTQTTSPTTPRFSAFFTEVVCTLGTTPPHVAASPPPKGGNGGIRDPTRRRHADSQPLMLQNPHRHRYGGHRRERRAWPRHPWAAGPGRTTSQRADRSERRGRLAGGPPPTGTHSGRGLRRPQHPWGHSNTWRPITPILIVGPNQPKYRLSRTRKPKSHAPSNTRSVL